MVSDPSPQVPGAELPPEVSSQVSSLWLLLEWLKRARERTAYHDESDRFLVDGEALRRVWKYLDELEAQGVR